MISGLSVKGGQAAIVVSCWREVIHYPWPPLAGQLTAWLLRISCADAERNDSQVSPSTTLSSVCHCVSWSQDSCDASFINVKRIAWALVWAWGGGEVANIGSGEEEKSLSLPTLRCPSDCSFTIYKGRGRRSPAQWMTHNFPPPYKCSVSHCILSSQGSLSSLLYNWIRWYLSKDSFSNFYT